MPVPYSSCHPERSEGPALKKKSCSLLRFVIPSAARDLLVTREYRFFVYIMSSKSRVIYTGMTNDLVGRVREHKLRKVKGFTKNYKVTRLVYFETLKYADKCIDREKQV